MALAGEYGGRIIEQLKRLGLVRLPGRALHARPALRQGGARGVRRAYEKGYIYRDRYMVNWDPGRSAISDLEVEEREATDTLYYIDYPLASGSGAITVATVRPETMLADTAIAVNPNDERYQRLIGETAILPLVGRRLKIIADDYVRQDFGTGALKITPGHDPNDFEIGRRHGLEQVIVIGEDGRTTDAAPERFRGLTTAEAAEAVTRDSRTGAHRADRGIHPHGPVLAALGRADRAAGLAAVVHAHGRARGAAIEAVRSGRVRFHPDRWSSLPRLDGEHPPLALSRQLWWGHRSRCGTVPPQGFPPGRETYVGVEPPAAKAGSAIPTCSTRGSRAPCGRS